jgi:hypothetical protein
LLPLQAARIGGQQTMAICHQDHGRVAMPVAAMLAGAVHPLLDLALGKGAAHRSFKAQLERLQLKETAAKEARRLAVKFRVFGVGFSDADFIAIS